MFLRKINMDDISVLEKLIMENGIKDTAVVDIKRKGKWVEITIFRYNLPVTVEDCAEVTRIFSNSEEVSNLFGEDCVIAVASPGIGRKLTTSREMEIFTGQEIIATWNKPDDNILYKTEAVLTNYDETGITVQNKENLLKLTWQDIKSIHLSEKEEKIRGEL